MLVIELEVNLITVTVFGVLCVIDGRFLFFLPWQDHVLVGTTDKPCKPNMRPEPDEEVRCLVKCTYFH